MRAWEGDWLLSKDAVVGSLDDPGFIVEVRGDDGTPAVPGPMAAGRPRDADLPARTRCSRPPRRPATSSDDIASNGPSGSSCSRGLRRHAAR
ncbi:DUF1918 domain-containing protein [Saccharomonospora marina]|uniref:DUF1918 domain-containing protein n=1 Tax=Saccharomonospora marina TaxID=632569 RepID=UPI0038CD2B57